MDEKYACYRYYTASEYIAPINELCNSLYNLGNDTTAPYDDGLSVERLDSQISNTRAALSCNMEPVSMDLTCSTQTEQHTQKVRYCNSHTL